MSHAQSPSSPAGSKAAMLGADPASGLVPANAAQPTNGSDSSQAAPTPVSTALASLPAALNNLPASLQQTGSQLLARFKGLTTTDKVLGGLLLVFVVRHFTRSR